MQTESKDLPHWSRLSIESVLTRALRFRSLFFSSVLILSIAFVFAIALYLINPFPLENWHKLFSLDTLNFISNFATQKTWQAVLILLGMTVPIWIFYSMIAGGLARKELVENHSQEITDVSKFFRLRALSLLWSLPTCLLGLAFFEMLIFATSLLLGIFFDFGAVIASILTPLGILTGFISALLFFGMISSFPLFPYAVAVEGTDNFDAVSRGFAYVYSRPLDYVIKQLGHLIVAISPGVIGLAFYLYGGLDQSLFIGFSTFSIVFFVSYFLSLQLPLYVYLREHVDSIPLSEYIKIIEPFPKEKMQDKPAEKTEPENVATDTKQESALNPVGENTPTVGTEIKPDNDPHSKDKTHFEEQISPPQETPKYKSPLKGNIEDIGKIFTVAFDLRKMFVLFLWLAATFGSMFVIYSSVLPSNYSSVVIYVIPFVAAQHLVSSGSISDIIFLLIPLFISALIGAAYHGVVARATAVELTTEGTRLELSILFQSGKRLFSKNILPSLLISIGFFGVVISTAGLLVDEQTLALLNQASRPTETLALVLGLSFLSIWIGGNSIFSIACDNTSFSKALDRFFSYMFHDIPTYALYQFKGLILSLLSVAFLLIFFLVMMFLTLFPVYLAFSIFGNYATPILTGTFNFGKSGILLDIAAAFFYGFSLITAGLLLGQVVSMLFSSQGIVYLLFRKYADKVDFETITLSDSEKKSIDKPLEVQKKKFSISTLIPLKHQEK